VKKDQEKTWMFWELGPFEYRSYKQVAREGLDVGAGLVELGLEKGDKVAIYADTSYVLRRSELIVAQIGSSWLKVDTG
jgi:long-subunit acyl-CoA synthetase (AMP-forming)